MHIVISLGKAVSHLYCWPIGIGINDAVNGSIVPTHVCTHMHKCACTYVCIATHHYLRTLTSIQYCLCGRFDFTRLQCPYGQEILDSGMCYVCCTYPHHPLTASYHAHLDYTYIGNIPRVIWYACVWNRHDNPHNLC